MIKIGHIYRFVYQEGNAMKPHGLIYGLVTDINEPEIEMFSLNGFLGSQHLSYDVMSHKQKLLYKKSGAGAILDHQESEAFYKKFKHVYRNIIIGAFKNS